MSYEKQELEKAAQYLREVTEIAMVTRAPGPIEYMKRMHRMGNAIGNGNRQDARKWAELSGIPADIEVVLNKLEGRQGE